MTDIEATTLEQVVSLARRLPLVDKIGLIERMAPEIERDMPKQRSVKRKPLLGPVR